MIDPNNITNYHLHRSQLEEHLLFWIAVAGKPAQRTAKSLDNLLSSLRTLAYKSENILPQNPFALLRILTNKHPDNKWLEDAMKEVGMGCYTKKAYSFIEVAKSKIDLSNCTAEELESLPGIGRKTSRCFIMHTRENAQYAGLDTHILRLLRDMGYDSPKSTPNSLRQYQELESKFIFLCSVVEESVAKFDLLIWRTYSQHPHWSSYLIDIVKNKLKTFRFHEREPSMFHIWTDGCEFVIARSIQDARTIIRQTHGMSSAEVENMQLAPLADNEMFIMPHHMGKKYVAKRCKDWIKILPKGYIDY